MIAVDALPGQAALADGETLVRNDSFGLSVMRFFMKTNLTLTSERLKGDSPKTSFWLISKGAEEFDYGLDNVLAVAINTTRSTPRLVVGLGLIAAGLWNLQSLWFLPIIGALLLLTAFKAVLSVTNDLLFNHNMEVSLLDRGSAQRFASQVKATIEARPPVVRNSWFTAGIEL